ncbi:MAG: permease-like cell division protein FtsX [bacterium]|nr:permease-like cell division protein FtsX [bacterium]
MQAFANALTTMRRTPYQSLAALLMVAVTFFVGYRLSFVLSGAHLVLSHFESSPQVIAFFKLDTEKQEMEALAKSLANTAGVTDVRLITQEQALKDYAKEYDDSPLLLELVTADILPASIEVSANNVDTLSQLAEALKKEGPVDDVIFQQDIVEQLSAWTKALRIAGIVDVGILSFASFLTITIIITLKAANKKYSVTIMRLIGASNWYINRPFVVEGILYGVLGALIGWVAITAILLYLTPTLSTFFSGIITFPIPLTFLLLQLGAGVLIGAILGGFASFVATNRFAQRA